MPVSSVARQPSNWAKWIKNIYKTDPLICFKCREPMRIITFITDQLECPVPRVWTTFPVSRRRSLEAMSVRDEWRTVKICQTGNTNNFTTPFSVWYRVGRNVEDGGIQISGRVRYQRSLVADRIRRPNWPLLVHKRRKTPWLLLEIREVSSKNSSSSLKSTTSAMLVSRNAGICLSKWPLFGISRAVSSSPTRVQGS